MQLISFALGIFLFAAFTLVILKYTTYLSNTKKWTTQHQDLSSSDPQQTIH